MAQLKFRSIWISDLHLGSKKLLDFLLQTKSEFLYLVGDIIDLLQAQKKWHWPKINDQIVKAVIEKAKEGTQDRLFVADCAFSHPFFSARKSFGAFLQDAGS